MDDVCLGMIIGGVASAAFFALFDALRHGGVVVSSAPEVRMPYPRRPGGRADRMISRKRRG